MSVIYTWPGFKLKQFNLFVKPNVRSFAGYYAGQSQTEDLLGEAWAATLILTPGNDPIAGAAQEAFFNRLRGASNWIGLWHLKRPAPQGTMRGTPTISGAVAQLATLINIQSTAGATLRAGDMLGFAGQVSQVMADITADGSGLFTGVEIWPRARVAISGGSAVVWSTPTVNMRLDNSDGVPIDWHPGSQYDGVSVTLAEV